MISIQYSSNNPYAGCTFHDLNNCGKGKNGEERLINVLQLQNKTEDHFKNLRVGYSNIQLSYWKEQHLIENRSGKLLSEVDEICPKHRETFGIHWKPSTVCQHPEHTGKKTKAARTVPGDLLIHLKSNGVHLPIGSKLCASHYKNCTGIK
jgi:hypothetical protein